MDESSLPKGVDAGVVARFDALKAALASACGADNDRVDDGDLDSLILSAALGDRPTAIFAMQEDEALRLVETAKAIGTFCKALPATAARSLTQLWWQPLLLRAGLMEVAAAGPLKLACLRLIAPGVMLFETELEDEAAASETNWLGGAHLMWSTT